MEELLKEFKTRMKIFHTVEDEQLLKALEASFMSIKRQAGLFDIDENKTGRELVLERTRYLYNDKVEEFTDAFISEIQGLAFEICEVENFE